MFYCLFRLPLWIILKLFFRLRAEGTENIPESGGAIIVSNHSSFLDPVAIGCAIQRPIHWVVQKPVYRVWWLKWFFALSGMICVNGVLTRCFSLLKKGEIVGIFPEGRRSRDGRLGRAEDGVSVMALQSKVCVIPCAILGAYKAYPPHRLFPRPGRVTVRIGKPIYFKEPEKEHIDEKTLAATTSLIMQAIEGLMG